MARPKKAVPSYRLHKPSGQAVVTIDGKDHYLGKHGSKESRERYARLIAELRRGDPPPPPQQIESLTVRSVVARYWRHVLAEGRYVKNDRPTTERELVRVVLKALLRLYGSTPARDFGPRRLKELRMELANGKCGRPRARTTVNADVRRVVRVFRWAVSEELIPSTVIWGLSAVAGLRRGEATYVRETEKVQPVPVEVIEGACRHLDPHLAAMVWLQFHSAMRPGEITAMCTADVDRSRDVWRYRPVSHKTEAHGVDRTIFLGPRAQEVLEPLLRPAVPEEPIFAPALIDALRKARQRQEAERRYAGAVRPNKSRDAAGRASPVRRFREVYSTATYRNAIRRACRAAGVELFSPNRIRHTALTRYRAAHGLDAAQVMGGHRISTTTEGYAEPDVSAAEAAIRSIG